MPEDKPNWPAILAQRGMALKYVPAADINYSLCMIAVRQNGLALEFVPKQFDSKELYAAAVQQDGFSIAFVPAVYRSEELLLTAVRQNGLVLAELFAREKTLNVCREAVMQNPEATEFVPHHLRRQIRTSQLDLDLLISDATERAHDRNTHTQITHQHINQNKDR